MSKQDEIDSLDYPPTHTYLLDELRPTGVLEHRVDLIKKVAPDFFTKAKRFLDVGCNKGWFSLWGSEIFDEVVGIDPRPEYIELCNKVKGHRTNVEFILTGFRDFTPEERFDRILLGNVHHYLYRECSGSWDWVYKLAAISNGQVLIEGPVDMTYQDMLNAIPEEQREHFNYEEFILVMNKFFVLKARIPTVRYTPGRYLMLFERKPSRIDNRYELDELPVVLILNWSDVRDIFLTRDNLVCKAYTGYQRTESYLRSRINIARMAPASNNIVGSVYDKGRMVGWVEEGLPGGTSNILHYFEREEEAFKAHCQQQIFFSRVGYFDLDPATLNFAGVEGKLVNFDKSAVHTIWRLGPEHWDLEKGTYFRCIKLSYKTIGDDVLRRISEAMATKNSVEIEKAYQDVMK